MAIGVLGGIADFTFSVTIQHKKKGTFILSYSITELQKKLLQNT